MPPGVDAWTLGRLVVVRRDAYARSSWPRLLAHELVHVRQQAELGLPRFLALYALDYLRGRRAGLGHAAAYRAVRFEREAYDGPGGGGPGAA